MSSSTFYGPKAGSLPVTIVLCVTTIWFHCDTVYQTLSTVFSTYLFLFSASTLMATLHRLHTSLFFFADFAPIIFQWLGALYRLYHVSYASSFYFEKKPQTFHPFVESLFPILGILYRMHHQSFLSMTPLSLIKIIRFVATDPKHLTMTAKVSCLTPLSSLFLMSGCISQSVAVPSRWPLPSKLALCPLPLL